MGGKKRGCFRNSTSSKQDILKVILLKVGKWPNEREELVNIDLDNNLFNWEEFMVCGLYF